MKQLDDFTKKKIEKENDKFQQMINDPMTAAMIADATKREKSDFYIHQVKKRYNNEPFHDAFITFDEYEKILENFMDAVKESRVSDAKLWHMRYCWIAPETVNAGFAIMDHIGEKIEDYMVSSMLTRQLSGEDTVNEVLDAVKRVTEENVKEHSKIVAKDLAYIISADFRIGDYIYELVSNMK